ncbi:MAG: DUF4139 domain-containing protein [Planctomycetota bacterium]|jgi:hypothetical protein
MKTVRTWGIVLGVVWANVAVTLAEPSLTIFNQDFAVVRDRVGLSLKKGENEVTVTDITAQAEPQSVILRDPTGKYAIRVLEQNYRADPVSAELLLSLYEGQEIDFITESEMVRGKIVRGGRVLRPMNGHWFDPFFFEDGYDEPPGAKDLPIIEVNGQLRFGLPGEPLFPSLKDETILKPTLHWLIEAEREVNLNAQLCYVTGGMNWEADYNLIYPEKGDIMDLIGWVTMNNESGKAFENARIKLMAGDVSKVRGGGGGYGGGYVAGLAGAARPPVSEKAFDEYHLYTLNRRTTLRDRQTKQVEFVRAEGVRSVRFYVYQGFMTDPRRVWPPASTRDKREYGTQSDTKVRVMREFENSKENRLGIPLPKGRVRFYRQDDDGQLEFTGENVIDHTPRDEKVRVYTGNAFDLVGERRQVDFRTDSARRMVDESFEIKVRNRKENKTVEIRVVERLYRKRNWEITEASREYAKTDSQTIEFRVLVGPDKEEVLTYTVHYTW